MTDLFSPTTTKGESRNLSGPIFRKQFELDARAVLVDVRTAAEFGAGSLKHARNLDYLAAGFVEEMAKLDKEKVYFLFCLSGNRSSHACSFMEKRGFRVYNLAGGIGQWPADNKKGLV